MDVEDQKKLVKLLESGMSKKEVANELKVSVSTVHYNMRKYLIPLYLQGKVPNYKL